MRVRGCGSASLLLRSGPFFHRLTAGGRQAAISGMDYVSQEEID
jgi:hypothetical protein